MFLTEINTGFDRVQYAQGDIDLPLHFADPFRVSNQYSYSEDDKKNE